MIKLNLLPPYINELGRIKMTIIIFVILFLLEGAVFLIWQNGLVQEQAWFKADQKRCQDRVDALNAYAKEAADMKLKADAYDTWITLFGNLQPVREYNAGIAKSMVEAAQKVGGSGSWYTKLSIQPDGSLSAEGKIRGSMKFLSYYFRLQDQQFTLEPAAKPYPEPVDAQVVALKVSGKVSPFPTAPALPESTPSNYSDWYKSASDKAGAKAGGAPMSNMPGMMGGGGAGAPSAATPTFLPPVPGMGGGAAAPAKSGKSR